MDMAIIGAGPAMRRLQTTIDLVARSSAPVLVTGETGVGKELVARAIHARKGLLT
jgi:transcriptional regulator with GAF, ATPase, and Fis domain